MITRADKKNIFPFLVGSIAIGCAENVAFFQFQTVFLSEAGIRLLSVALFCYVVLFIAGLLSLGARSLWLLLGLPLVLFPLVIASTPI